MGRPLAIDINIRTRDRETAWLLRDLEGKWLIEGQGPRMVSAHCSQSLAAVFSHAIAYHDGIQDEDR